MGSAVRNLPGYIYGAVLIAILALTLVVPAIFAGWIAPHDPFTTNAYDRLAPPAWMDRGTAKNLLGADFLGRDLLSRLIHGGRTEFTVVALCIAGSSAIGVPLGLGARRWGGRRDAVIMRAASVVRWALVVVGFLYGFGIVIALVAWLVFLIRSVGRPAAAWSMLWTDRIRPG
jgi:peptide/nickel transport system permease protein